MDLFVFFPRQWLNPLSPRELSETLWARAACHCIRGSRNRPEAVLHVVQKEHNLSVRLIGNRSRGSLQDLHKSSFLVPDANVWHSHNMPAVLAWLLRNRTARKPASKGREGTACRE